jgi:rod shape-determining protein MreC
MGNLLLILLRFKDALVYFILSILCLYFAVNFNHIQRVNWMHASNSVGGAVYKGTSNVNSYFLLKDENKRLAQANAQLMADLDRLRYNYNLVGDSLYGMNARLKADSSYWKDSTRFKNPRLFDESVNSSYIPCRVVYNSVVDNTNFITIDKGRLDGIKEGNGIVTGYGILGKVVSTSLHYSLVKSVLHVHNSVSAKIKNSNELGSIKWNGKSSNYVTLTEIPRHLKINKGDTVITTSYNSVYPANHPIGRIEEVSVDENQPFWDIKVRLFENHQKLEHCYAYKNQLFFEKNALIQQKDSLY